MAALLKGISVVLHERVQTGVDAFGAPVYREVPVAVKNVLVTPIAAQGVVNAEQLRGTREECELCLPKGDAHRWDGCRVDFWGKRWRVFTPTAGYIAALVPLDWDRKVRVERYG